MFFCHRFCALEKKWIAEIDKAYFKGTAEEIQNYISSYLGDDRYVFGSGKFFSSFTFFIHRKVTVEINGVPKRISVYQCGSFHDPTLGNSVYPGFFLPMSERGEQIHRVFFDDEMNPGCAAGLICLCRKEFKKADEDTWNKIFYCSNGDLETKTQRKKISNEFHLLYRAVDDIFDRFDSIVVTKPRVKFFIRSFGAKQVHIMDVEKSGPPNMFEIIHRLKKLYTIYHSDWYMPAIIRFFANNTITKMYRYTNKGYIEADPNQEILENTLMSTEECFLTYNLPCFVNDGERAHIWFHELCLGNTMKLCPCCNQPLVAGNVVLDNSLNLFGKVCLAPESEANYIFINTSQ